MQNGRADRAARNAECVLCEGKDVVPQPCLEMALHLRQVEVWSLAPCQLPSRAMEEVQPKVEQASGYRSAINGYVFLVEVPSARAHDDGGELIVRIEFVLAP